ncbi:MAG TPA: hypothetical protein VK832_19490, partial [Burkholderiaceae bacterium]|nr:hypothetical protein [Burkholderiaceae bacterium]
GSGDNTLYGSFTRDIMSGNYGAVTFNLDGVVIQFTRFAFALNAPDLIAQSQEALFNFKVTPQVATTDTAPLYAGTLPQPVSTAGTQNAEGAGVTAPSDGSVPEAPLDTPFSSDSEDSATASDASGNANQADASGNTNQTPAQRDAASHDDSDQDLLRHKKSKSVKPATEQETKKQAQSETVVAPQAAAKAPVNRVWVQNSDGSWVQADINTPLRSMLTLDVQNDEADAVALVQHDHAEQDAQNVAWFDSLNLETQVASAQLPAERVAVVW